MDPSAFAESPAAVVMAGVFGALWGSFFNVCIARVPRGLSVVRPGSHCFACKAPVRPLDNVPVFSYFVLGGRCRSCGVTFSPRYALVEALMGGLSAFLYWKFVLEAPGALLGLRMARFALGFAFAGVLLVLSFIDLDTKRLPDVITLPSIPVFFLAGFGTGDVPWLDRLIGLCAGYLFVRIIADGYYYLTGREGLGLGDGKLLAVIGAVLGWRALPMTVFLAASLGTLITVPLLLVARRRLSPAEGPATGDGGGDTETPEGAEAGEADPRSSVRLTEVPFGPYLSLSALVLFVFFYGRDPMVWLSDRLAGG